jgi:hypothetical protein
MLRKANRSGDAHNEEEQVRPYTETPPRVLYWWHVPERPGVGAGMLLIVGVWFATLFALAVVIGVLVAVAS